MALAFYMDHHVPKAITNGLRLRGIDVLTAYEDGTNEYDDDDLLNEAAKRIQENIPFYGVIYAHQLRVSTGVCVNELEMIAQVGSLKILTTGCNSYHCDFVLSIDLKLSALPNTA